jgi:hypothetical protein
MPCNEGKVDRLVRILAGGAILSLYFVGPQSPWGLIGVVPLLTGLIGYCPAYSLIGVNTCARKA